MKRKWVNIILGWLYDLALDLGVEITRSESEIALSQEWDRWLTWNEKDVSHAFMTMILTSVTMVGWPDVPDSDSGDFRRRRAVDISSFLHGTLVLSFHIGVVLTLSILIEGFTYYISLALSILKIFQTYLFGCYQSGNVSCRTADFIRNQEEQPHSPNVWCVQKELGKRHGTYATSFWPYIW